MKWLSVFALLFSLSAFANVGEPLERLPMQDSGRIKPFDTFARETLQLIYGKKSYEKKSATEVVFTWLLIPDHWMDTPVIEIRNKGVGEALKIQVDGEHKYFKPRDLFANERLPLLMQELANLREKGEKLNPYYQAVQRLENQLGLFNAIRNGRALRFVPSKDSETWKSVAELDGEMRDAFTKVTKGFVDSIAAGGDKAQPSEEFKTAVKDFVAMARAQAPEHYADMTKIGWEIHLNHFQPFMWAWIAYLIGLLFLVLAEAGGLKWAIPPSWVFLIVGFILHGYGMALRSYIAGRPPVSNMYETVVWVPFGAMLFAFILERVQRNKLLLIGSSMVAIFCLILTDLAPTVLDASLHPLEPVLRSNFWLVTHVLIINISYAAFFLAFALGDVLLFVHLKDEQKYAQFIARGSLSIYRAIQIGVVLIAAGTILGGVWADYSWGRFWGWDPKETWALITLLGYLALLHGRLAGWVKNFELAAGAIVAFSLVIMAWYGVNFALGAGLHTYGFGAGGVEYVTAFVIAHLLYVAYVTTVRYGRLKNARR